MDNTVSQSLDRVSVCNDRPLTSSITLRHLHSMINTPLFYAAMKHDL